MLQNIRDNTQGTIAKVIIAIISIPFVLFGVESLFSSGPANKAAKVNGEDISVQELNQAINFRKQQLLSQGGNIDPAMLDDTRLKGPALDALIDREVLLQAALGEDMAVGRSQINKIVLDSPNFKIDGKFSKELFRQFLAQRQINADTFYRLYTDELLLAQLSDGYVATGFMTEAEIGIDTRFTHQTRDIRLIKLPLADAEKGIDASDEAVKAYYEANPKNFQSEESVVAEYIELKLSDYFKPVSDKDLQDAYDEEMANFDAQETREVAHILIQLDNDTSKEQARETLQKVKAELDGGADFAAMAKQYSEDLGSKEFEGALGTLNEDAFPAEFVAAAQALDAGQVSDIVETESGMHLIKLTALNKKTPPSLEDRKAKLTEELQIANAEADFWGAVEELKEISFNAPDLSEPASALNTDVKTSPLMTRKPSSAQLAKPQVIAALFSNDLLKDGINSDVIELSKEHVVIVRVKEHNPVALLPFDEVKAQAKAGYIKQQAEQQLAEQAKVIEQDLQKGADVEALAKEKSLAWELLLAAKRTSPKADRAIMTKAFALPAPSAEQRAIDVVQLTNGDYAVIAVNNVVDGKLSDLNEVESKAMRSFLSRARASEQFQALQKALKEKADIKRYNT